MILAIDQSYTATGVCYISDDNRIETAVIKTTPDQPWEERIEFILSNLDTFFNLSAISMENPSPVQYVVLESYAYSKCGSNIFQLGELGGIIKYHFYKKGIMPYTMLIGHSKMFSARNGSATKKEVIRGLQKRFNITETDDNVADAISIGLSLKMWIDFKNGKLPKSGYDKTLVRQIDEFFKEADPEAKREKKKAKKKAPLSKEKLLALPLAKF